MSEAELRAGTPLLDSNIDEDDAVDPGDIQAEEVDPLDYLLKLIKLCKYVIKLREKDDGKERKNRRSPILQMLMNYDEAITKYELTFDDVILDIFNAYCDNKRYILDDDHIWLMDEKRDIKFSYCRPNFVPRNYKSTCTICIGSIYRMACRMYEKHSHDKIVANKPNIYQYLPTRIIRYLYLMFIESIQNPDHQDILGELVDRKEQLLGITDGMYDEDFGEGLGGNFKGGLETIMKVVFRVFKTNNIKLPEGMNLDSLNFGDISGIAAKLFDSKDSFISDILKEIGTCESGVDMAKMLMNKIKDQEFIDKVVGLLGLKVSTDKIKEAIMTNETALTSIINSSFPDIKKKMDTVSEATANGMSLSEAVMDAINDITPPELIEVIPTGTLVDDTPKLLSFIDTTPLPPTSPFAITSVDSGLPPISIESTDLPLL